MNIYFNTPLQDYCAPPDDDRPEVYECHECGEPIRDGDGYYLIDEEYYCDNCVERNHSYAEYEPDYWEDD